MATRDTCTVLQKVAPDEPIFVLRARDLLAPDTIRYWAMLAKASGVNTAKWQEAQVCAKQMEEWSGKRKYPD
jgi:hypothetical protein